ncbi:MAG: ABC transporter permease [Deltaproteobacteria bacterium]|nr:ABC transporter permease [Deltaproteobacteria bacterium]
MTDRAPSSLVELTLTRIRLFFREPSAVFWTFGFPLLLSVALGVAFRNRPPQPVVAAIAAGPGAEEALRAVVAAGQKGAVLPVAAARAALRTGKTDVVVLPGSPRTYEYDPTREDSRLARLVVDDLLQRAEGRRDPTAVAEVTVTEPGSRYVDFLIPGLLGVNIMSAGMWGIGYVIVETRQKKLLKRLVATPMRRSEYLLSFVILRLLFVFLEIPVLLGFGWLAFSVPVHGSLALLVAISLVGALCFAGMGLLVACRAQNVQTVGGLINLVMMPMFLLSGVFFSASHFPDLLQPFIRVLPLTALNDALRLVMNEGLGLAAVGPRLLLLAGLAIVTFAAALRWFRWS